MSSTDTVAPTLMEDRAPGKGLTIERFFTELGANPFDTVEWELRTAAVGGFRQDDVEFPKSWSQNATNIVAQKYFRGQLDSPVRERSVKQMIGRVSGTIANWGRERGYFATSEDAGTFEAELAYILLHQLAAFNSPVWFNVGFEEHPQCSACFILSVEDDLDAILDWNTREGRIFRGGSGSGINLSRIRGSMEPLSKGGTASGPVSFMRGADSWAGTIKSGGKTRRAAKMVVLDVDHPDIVEFIECKAKEEDKAEALRAAGFDMSIDGDGFKSIQFQNANNSVRVTDAFMEAVESGAEWRTMARSNGKPIGPVMLARELMRKIGEAAWRCADPGVQYDTIINQWHTCPNSGRINASNPCSEYMHVDDSACNLASLNLMKFRHPDGTFEVERFERAVDIVLLAQEIVVGPSSYPTEQIGVNARAFRQLGMGYANLGAYLMSNGMPYDSDAGRATAAAITALMTGRAYRQSAVIARDMVGTEDNYPGPYEHFARNRNAHLNVMHMHCDAALANVDSGLLDCPDPSLFEAANFVWGEVIELGELHGFRNAQATVLAPTGTISFLMDCDTTGVEPDFSLVKHKELVGGGTMIIVNQTVGLALQTLGYTAEEVSAIVAYISEEIDDGQGGKVVRGTIIGAPGFKDEHLEVFDVAVGKRAISHMGHIEMMGAVQPFISGAISKTVNLPSSATVEDIVDAYMQAWRLGVKALAIYRDGSKTAQALRTDAQKGAGAVALDSEEFAAAVQAEVATQLETIGPRRKRMPRERQSITHKFSIGGHEGYITAGLYEDGTVGEIFLTDIGKEGSTLRGMMNSFATAISIALQYGVPLETLVSKFAYMRFEPEGITQNPEIPFAKSLPDYIMRWLGSRFCDVELQVELGIQTPQAKALEARNAAIKQGLDPDTQVVVEASTGDTAIPTNGNGSVSAPRHSVALELGPPCGQCGAMMRRTGSCHTCPDCGYNTGCG
jgi:ribonucleoside-diphosphate reductase alpha chain